MQKYLQKWDLFSVDLQVAWETSLTSCTGNATQLYPSRCQIMSVITFASPILSVFVNEILKLFPLSAVWLTGSPLWSTI